MAHVTVGANGATRAVEAERRARGWWRLVLAAASGLLLSAAFPALDIEPLAWIGLVPLLLASDGLTPRSAFGVGWVGGFVFFVATVYWVAYTITNYTNVPMPLAVGILLLMSSILACYMGAFAAGVRWFEQNGLPALWLAPALWVTLEWLRSWFFIGFPWAALGYSQYRYRDIVQLVEVTGVYGVSALVVLFNIVVAAVVRPGTPRRRGLVPALVALTILVAVVPLAGRWRAAALAARPPAGTLRVAIVQGNVEQDHKWDPVYVDQTMATYADLTTAAAAARPDLIVWPETATPFFFQQAGAKRDEVRALASRHRVHLLFGSPAARRAADGSIEELNRAYLLSQHGEELASYDKIELVPFGEYVPYRSVLFFVDQIVHAVGTIVPGLTPTVFQLPTSRFGVLICYEDVFPALTRRFIQGGADFLVNITNDAWYGPTSAPHQHLAQATFRAIEYRVPLVRAANTGISAVIAPDGQIQWRSELFETSWHVAEIAWPGVRTIYARVGDLFAWTCAATVLVAVAIGIGRRRRLGGSVR
jgi:apolipoprotein N-acyltransferase